MKDHNELFSESVRDILHLAGGIDLGVADPEYLAGKAEDFIEFLELFLHFPAKIMIDWHTECYFGESHSLRFISGIYTAGISWSGAVHCIWMKTVSPVLENLNELFKLVKYILAGSVDVSWNLWKSSLRSCEEGNAMFPHN